MSDFFRSVRVKLKDDLTRYHPTLVVGLEGMTVPAVSMWARSSDRFCGVRFPSVTLDVLWSGIEIVDAEYLAEAAKKKAAVLEMIKATTKEAVKHLGPRGGFRSLSFSYTDGQGCGTNYNTGFKEEAERYERLFAELRIPIRVVRA